jgi:hypothetical protein
MGFGISHMIACYAFLSGCAFIVRSPVPLLGTAETTRNNTVKNDNEKKTNNSCLKIAGG